MPSGDHPLMLPTMLGASANAAGLPEDNGMDYGEDAGLEDDGAEEVLVLQQFMQQALDKKKQAAAKQQARVLQELKADAEKRIAALEAAISKEAKDSTTVAKSTFTKAMQRLTDKLAQMEGLYAKYQQDMATLWQQYDEDYKALGESSAQIKAACEKRKQGAKRKIAALAKENEAALAEAAKKVEAAKGRAGKMPQLAKLLQSLI